MAPHILPRLETDLAAELESQVLQPGFKIHSRRQVVEILPDAVLLDDGTRLAADLVMLGVGVRPENRLAKAAGLELGITGGLKTNGQMQTSDPNIYAVGDMAEVRHRLTGAAMRIPLAGPANRQGRVAGANAAGAHLNYGGGLGTSIVRVLDQVVGFVGLNTQEADAAKLSYRVSVTRDLHHAGYYPGAQSLVTLLISEEGSGRLLGAQVMGKAGVDKRIDVLATAMHGHLTVFDLEELDLAYAPPFGAANDPINVAGFVASRELRGEIVCQDPRAGLPSGHLLLDVRSHAEVKQGRLTGAQHIPLDNLREQLSAIPADMPIVVYCQKGLRGYLATRILMESGFAEVRHLKGGFLQAKWNGLGQEEAVASF